MEIRTKEGTFGTQLKKLNKKYWHRGIAIYTLHRRVFNTAVSVLEIIEKVSFESLSLNLYFLIEDKGFSELAESYKRTIEIAKMQPEKFIVQLYEFFLKQANIIKKQNLYSQFFEFVSLLLGLCNVSNGSDEFKVYNAYLNLLLEQTEFLRGNKFEINKIVAGIDTRGQIIEVDDPYPNLDVAAYELEQNFSLTAIERVFGKWGYQAKNLEEVDLYRYSSQVYTNNTVYLIPYINEFTADIIPSKPVNSDYMRYSERIPHIRKRCNFTSCLSEKRRTLPSNGIRITFCNSFFKSLLLKEVYKNGSIIVLYKIDSEADEFSGTYDTVNNTFYSVFGHSAGDEMLKTDHVIKNLVLWAYTSYVTGELVSINTENYTTVFKEDKEVTVSFIQMGGKLKVPATGLPKRLIAYQNGYDSSVKHISGYIRKLPDGQKASDKAVKMAEALGYKLNSNETYVLPFERTTWIKKK